MPCFVSSSTRCALCVLGGVVRLCSSNPGLHPVVCWRVWCTTCRDCCGCVQGCVCERGVGGGASGSKEHERVPFFPKALPPTPLFVVWLRRFPTLPHPVGCSTIGVVGLSFRVRNVAGRFPNTMTTASLVYPLPTPTCAWCARVFWGVCGLDVIRIVVVSTSVSCSPIVLGGFVFSVGRLVPVGLRAHYCASTSGLSTQ